MDDNTAFVAWASVAAAVVTLISNWLLPRAKVVQLNAEADTNVRIKGAEIEFQAFKTINDLLMKSDAQNNELQRTLLANHNALTEFLERQTVAIEKLIHILERITPP